MHGSKNYWIQKSEATPKEIHNSTRSASAGPAVVIAVSEWRQARLAGREGLSLLVLEGPGMQISRA